MGISPVGMMPSMPGIGATGSTSPVARPSTTQPAQDEGTSFGDAITKAVDALSESHAEADRLALQAATGDLNAVHDYTVAATEAQLLTQLTVEVRNRAVEAFNDIMRMQV
jgi:flagellar hook-basal body complex protein FliE